MFEQLKAQAEVFNKEISFQRKSRRHKYEVTIIHTPTGLKKKHEAKSIREYTKNNTDSQLKLSLWFLVYQKTRQEWIESISDPEVRVKLYANIRVDMQTKYPTLSSAIQNSGLWQRWPEGREYWENVVYGFIKDEAVIEMELMKLL